jgi:hypothetical protein
MPRPEFDLEEALAVVHELAGRPDVDIGLLIYPRLSVSREEFARLVRVLGNADDRRWPRGEVPMAMAAFHPDAKAELGDPARLVPFIRRSPDPTLQLVRLEVLNKLRGTEPSGTGFVDPELLARRGLSAIAGSVRTPLHERVAEDNLETVRRVGVGAIEAILADIRADRDRSYARIEAAEPPVS